MDKEILFLDKIKVNEDSYYDNFKYNVKFLANNVVIRDEQIRPRRGLPPEWGTININNGFQIDMNALNQLQQNAQNVQFVNDERQVQNQNWTATGALLAMDNHARHLAIAAEQQAEANRQEAMVQTWFTNTGGHWVFAGGRDDRED